MRDPSGEADKDTSDPKASDHDRWQARNRSFRRRRVSTSDARGTQTRRGVQLAGDGRVGAEGSIRRPLQGGETPGGQIPRRIRGIEAADGGALAQALQETAQDQSTDYHIRHVSGGSGEVCRGQREVGSPAARVPGLPQRHGRLGLDASKSTVAN